MCKHRKDGRERGGVVVQITWTVNEKVHLSDVVRLLLCKLGKSECLSSAGG